MQLKVRTKGRETSAISWTSILLLLDTFQILCKNLELFVGKLEVLQNLGLETGLKNMNVEQLTDTEVLV